MHLGSSPTVWEGSAASLQPFLTIRTWATCSIRRLLPPVRTLLYKLFMNPLSWQQNSVAARWDNVLSLVARSGLNKRLTSVSQRKQPWPFSLPTRSLPPPTPPRKSCLYWPLPQLTARRARSSMWCQFLSASACFSLSSQSAIGKRFTPIHRAAARTLLPKRTSALMPACRRSFTAG
jgi:hypothetical protein